MGQLVYESRCGAADWSDVFSGIGVRLYQDVENQQHFLCVEASESGDEQWYRVEGATLVSLSDDDLRQLGRAQGVLKILRRPASAVV